MDQRLRFIARLLDGETMSDLCREFGISRKTGHMIFNRYKTAGVAAIADRSRRPVRYARSTRPYQGLPDLRYPLHDRQYMVTACGRICLHRKKINLSTVLAGQLVGLKEVDDGAWLVSFMHDDLGYIDLEQRTLQPLDNPFGPRLSPMS